MTGALHEVVYAFFIVSCSVLLRMENIFDKVVEKIKTRFSSSISVFETRAIYERMLKMQSRVDYR